MLDASIASTDTHDYWLEPDAHQDTRVEPAALRARAAPSSPEVSIILATLNEAYALPRLVSRLNGLGLPSYEIIVVDDGSTDGTREIVKKLEESDERVRGVFHDGRRKLAAAQTEGIACASGAYALVMDADLQHPATVAAELLQRLRGGADLVVASRYVPGGTAGRRPLLRSIISRGAEVLVKLCIREARLVRDPLSGFFAFRRDRVDLRGLDQRGYKTLLQVLIALSAGTVVEIPYSFEERPRGESKIVSSIRFIPVFVSEVLRANRLRRKLRSGAV